MRGAPRPMPLETMSSDVMGLFHSPAGSASFIVVSENGAADLS